MCKPRKSVVTKGGDKAQGFGSEVSNAPGIIHTWTVSMLTRESIVFLPILTLS